MNGIMGETVNRIEFVRRVGESGRIAIPKYVARRFVGKVVKVTIEVLDEGCGDG